MITGNGASMPDPGDIPTNRHDLPHQAFTQPSPRTRSANVDTMVAVDNWYADQEYEQLSDVPECAPVLAAVGGLVAAAVGAFLLGRKRSR